MQVPAIERKSVQVGPFAVDFSSRELRRNGSRISLQEKPFQLLAVLLERPGELVTREELRQKLWPADTFVDFEHSINTAVRKLREALEDHAEGPRFIETVPRLGYRLIVPVTTSPNAEVRSAPPALERDTGAHRWWRRQYLLVTGVVALGAFLLAWNVPGVRERLRQRWHPAQTTPDRIDSLAVLPFENLSGDSSKDYFADGFTDELITDLAEQTRIRVVSRSSVMRYRGSKKPLPEIAQELNVDAIVEGSVSISDEKVRITAQLIQAPIDRHLWAHSYERNRKDLFSIQSDVADTVARLIGTKANGVDPNVRPALPRPRFTEATHELYLECLSLFNSSTDEGIARAIQCYQHILKLDPASPAAYAELAFCHMALGMDHVPDAQKAALKAIALDPSLPEAHLALAEFELFYKKDLAGAEKELLQVLELNPSNAQAHLDYASLLVAIRRTPRALVEAKTARQLDPFSYSVASYSGRIFFMAGQYDRAIEEENAALDLDPRKPRGRYWIGYAYEQQGRYREAITEYNKVLPQDDHGIFLTALGRSFALAGDSQQAAEVKRKIEHFSGKSFLWPYDAALFYAALGDNDRAFEWLAKDQQMRDGWLLWLNVDPRLSALRSEPRFIELIRRVGLPE